VESFATYAYSCRFGACEFSIVFWLKTKENSHALKRPLYAYAANDSTLRGRLDEKGCPRQQGYLGCRVSLLLYITQFVLHVREGAPRRRVSLP